MPGPASNRQTAPISEQTQQRIVALLLGLATVMAGVFTWRAGQIGSTAAALDRRSGSETIKQEQQRVEVGGAALGDAVAYVTYVAQYEIAAAMDDLADEVEEQGAVTLASDERQAAGDVRLAATVRAAGAGVFGREAVYQDLADPTPDPRPFDFADHVEVLTAQVTTGLDSPGHLDPQKWADESTAIRHRTRELQFAALVMLGAVALYTAAQMTFSQRARILSGAAGFVVFLATTILTFTTVF